MTQDLTQTPEFRTVVTSEAEMVSLASLHFKNGEIVRDDGGQQKTENADPHLRAPSFHVGSRVQVLKSFYDGAQRVVKFPTQCTLIFERPPLITSLKSDLTKAVSSRSPLSTR